MYKQKGFTLIELLVVISVIGLLASVVLIAINSARVKARDAKRIADIRQLQTALDTYYDQNNNNYPNPDADTLCGGWDTSSVDPFITALVTAGIMTKTPVDPVNSASACGPYAYRYYYYAAGTAGCDPARGAFYVLEIYAFEGLTPPATSPGWSCPSLNWSSPGGPAYVTGKFSK